MTLARKDQRIMISKRNGQKAHGYGHQEAELYHT